MKKVLITGIDSFTGKHLSSHLQKAGYDVYGTSFFKADEKKYQCDITKKDEVQNVLKVVQPEYFIHLSGISFAAHSNNEEFYRVNTIGTLNILESFQELNLHPKKIILASSATVYGNQSVELLDESLCPKPTNHYGASKLAMESLAANYFSKLNIIITRPFNYTGVGQQEQFLIPKIVKHFKEKKELIELGNIDVSREFNDVSYVCEVYQKLLESTVKSQALNIASNRGVKLLEVIDMMNDLAGYVIQVKVNPDFLRKGEIQTLTGSPQKLFSFIGEVKQKELKQMLQEMLQS